MHLLEGSYAAVPLPYPTAPTMRPSLALRLPAEYQLKTLTIHARVIIIQVLGTPGLCKRLAQPLREVEVRRRREQGAVKEGCFFDMLPNIFYRTFVGIRKGFTTSITTLMVTIGERLPQITAKLQAVFCAVPYFILHVMYALTFMLVTYLS